MDTDVYATFEVFPGLLFFAFYLHRKIFVMLFCDFFCQIKALLGLELYNHLRVHFGRSKKWVYSRIPSYGSKLACFQSLVFYVF